MGKGNKYADHFKRGNVEDLNNYFRFEDDGFHFYGSRSYKTRYMFTFEEENSEPEFLFSGFQYVFMNMPMYAMMADCAMDEL